MPLLGGEQRRSRNKAIFQPILKPYFFKAIIAYSEQEG